MIPISLEFQGVYSYQQPAKIDFTKLAAAGIFGIFGAVGSGKSTILEAITFVLYGSLNRLNSKDNVAYNIMNLQSNSMQISFVFSHEDQIYKFEYYAKRSGKHLDKMSKAERKAYKQVDDTWEPISNDASKIIHLSYDDFKRIVIIPQGMFSEFIQLKPTERTGMLKALFQLDQYDLYDKAKLQLNQIDTNLAILNSKIEELADINVEVIGALRADKVAKEAQLHEVKTQVTALQQKVQEWKDLEQKVQLLEELKASLNKIQSDAPQFQAWEVQLKQYRTIKDAFGLLQAQRVDTKAQIDRWHQEAKQKNEDLKEAQEKLNKLESTRYQWQSEFETLENLQSKIQEYNIAIQYVQFLNALAEIDVTITHERNKLEDYQNKAAIINASIENLNTTLQALEVEIQQEASWMELQYKWTHYSQLLEQKNQLVHFIEEQSQSSAQFLEQKQTLIASLFPADDMRVHWEAQPIQVLKSFLNQSIQDYNLSLQQVKLQINEVQGWSKLEDFAQHLSPDQPCPLCGSMTHPQIYSSQDARTQVATLIHEEQQIFEKLQKYNGAVLTLEHIIDNYRRYKSIIDARTKEMQNLESEINKVLATIPAGIQLQDISKALESIQAQKNQYKNAQEQLQQSQQALQQLPLMDLQQLIQQKEWEKAQIQLQLTSLDIQDASIIKGENLEMLNAALDRCKSIHQSWLALIKPMQDLNNAIFLLKEQYAQIQAYIAQYETQYQGYSNTWKELLSIHQLEEDAILEILQQQEDWANIEQQILAHHQLRAVTEKQMVDVENQLQGKQLDKLAMAQDYELLTSLQSEYAALLQLVGAMEAQLQQLDMKYSQLLQLKDAYEAETAQRSQVEVLTKLFSAQGFVKYVSLKYLRNLVSMANYRFVKFTHNQLELDLDEDGNFIVIDYLNNGYRRLLKTLSGGQSFQAALSLALALSEQIQLVQKFGQQFFFLDEGFGALDKQSLGVVIDTLKQVQQEGRVVGLISHVEELQSEIDYRLNVYNDPMTGSRIVASY